MLKKWIKAVWKWRTVLFVYCCDCGRFRRIKAGDGASGRSDGMCRCCFTIRRAELKLA